MAQCTKYGSEIKDIKTIKLFMKVRDEFYCRLADENGDRGEYEGYVPDFFPNDDDGSSHYGDYLILNIDAETGRIMNWKKPTQEQLQALLISEDE